MNQCSHLFRIRTNEKRKFFHKFEEKRYLALKKDFEKRKQAFSEKPPVEPNYLSEHKGSKHPEIIVPDNDHCQTIFVNKNGSNIQPLTDVRRRAPNQSDTLDITPHWLKTRKGETIPSILITHKSDNIGPLPSSSAEIGTIIKNQRALKTFPTPSPNASRRPLIVFSHGNSTDIGWMFESIRILSREWGVNFLTYEYSGYGLATGKPSESNTFADIEAAYDFAINVMLVDPRLLVVYGQSVGSGPTAHILAASGGKLGGAIFHSGLASGVRIFAPQIESTPWFDMYPNVDLVKRGQAKVIVLHGKKDREVPVTHGKMLAQSAKDANVLFDFVQFDAGHNNIETGPTRRQFLFVVLKFLVRGVVQSQPDIASGSCQEWVTRMNDRINTAEETMKALVNAMKDNKKLLGSSNNQHNNTDQNTTNNLASNNEQSGVVKPMVIGPASTTTTMPAIDLISGDDSDYAFRSQNQSDEIRSSNRQEGHLPNSNIRNRFENQADAPASDYGVIGKPSSLAPVIYND
eukprot:GDKJ01004367.1.p1 GENE.GDKJ01004367.1~~GDKJ01004367.1.p1  ORF type:complete len:579 (+),score=91.00 GDKJ01004367.1:184-1737(+)